MGRLLPRLESIREMDGLLVAHIRGEHTLVYERDGNIIKTQCLSGYRSPDKEYSEHARCNHLSGTLHLDSGKASCTSIPFTHSLEAITAQVQSTAHAYADVTAQKELDAYLDTHLPFGVYAAPERGMAASLVALSPIAAAIGAFAYPLSLLFPPDPEEEQMTWKEALLAPVTYPREMIRGARDCMQRLLLRYIEREGAEVKMFADGSLGGFSKAYLSQDGIYTVLTLEGDRIKSTVHSHENRQVWRNLEGVAKAQTACGTNKGLQKHVLSLPHEVLDHINDFVQKREDGMLYSLRPSLRFDDHADILHKAGWI